MTKKIIKSINQIGIYVGISQGFKFDNAFIAGVGEHEYHGQDQILDDKLSTSTTSATSTEELEITISKMA